MRKSDLIIGLILVVNIFITSKYQKTQMSIKSNIIICFLKFIKGIKQLKKIK